MLIDLAEKKADEAPSSPTFSRPVHGLSARSVGDLRGEPA